MFRRAQARTRMGGESQEPGSLAVNGTAWSSRFGVGGSPPILFDIGLRVGCVGSLRGERYVVQGLLI